MYEVAFRVRVEEPAAEFEVIIQADSLDEQERIADLKAIGRAIQEGWSGVENPLTPPAASLVVWGWAANSLTAQGRDGAAVISEVCLTPNGLATYRFIPLRNS